ncbi:DUF354 domain-containing protein [Butyrivibrio sp. CB08]|uniref:DUF354 domain-containing protein n=1 Tax=Butyrivibrio sp. CB08 TaxID=2364879 RepID=UPI001313FD59|nr:DUF354 domain-containing protein [Butyrivibrio sp. CB08]
MRVGISIEHPAWAHQFKNIIKKVNTDGTALVLAVDKDGDLDLLDSFGIEYVKLADSTGKNVLEKGFLFIKLCVGYYREIKRFKPDVLIGRASPMMAVAAWLTGKPHIIFEDTEVSKFSLNICKRFSKCIITPEMFHTNLGNKQKRLPVYKELFYLHRDFVPDIDILQKLGIRAGTPFSIVRFVSWNASHDVGMRGLPNMEKIRFIRRIEELMPVYISSEGELPEELESYRLNIPYEMVHHVLYYATFVFSEGASMASEAAILGTYAFYLNQIASGTTEEQENKFHLLRVLHDPKTRYNEAIKEATELMKNPSLWEEGKEKREEILKEMPNPNEIFWQKMIEVVS